jgi:hypothetical protein
VIFLNIQFLILSNAITQINIRTIAISTFTPELMRGSKPPAPENDKGPIKTTINPPPIIIKIHITKINEKIGIDIR